MMTRAWLLDEAVTIALQQDERKQRLLLRFTAASSTLERLSGVIGLAKNFGSAAGAVSRATQGIIEKFCTPGSSAPGLSDESAADLAVNVTLLNKIRKSTEVFVADAAGDEQKSAELLRHKLSSNGEAFLPNLRMGLRDAAHASRRVIKRPSDADPVLREIMQSLFFGKDSIVAAVENSLLLKNRFEAHIARDSAPTVKSRIRSLSLAKQRFDSTQKPLGRFVLYLLPFLTTVIELSREKKGEENGMRATAFLAYINEEILLQVGMLADAGDEGGQLCRSFDRELPASEELASVLESFREKITCLFCADEPVCLSTGYTYHMLRTLQEREMLLPTIDGKSVKVLGGKSSVTAEMVERCLSRMRTWVQLAKACMQHEFPEWDIISSFHVFHVTADKTSTSQSREAQIRRLAKFFQVDEILFRAQLDDLSAMARAYAKRSHCDSLTAWKHTIHECTSTLKRRERHPCDVLQAPSPQLQIKTIAGGAGPMGWLDPFIKRCGAKLRSWHTLFSRIAVARFRGYRMQ